MSPYGQDVSQRCSEKKKEHGDISTWLEGHLVIEDDCTAMSDGEGALM